MFCMTNFTHSKLLYIVLKNSAEISESIQLKMKGLNTEPKMKGLNTELKMKGLNTEPKIKWKETINY